MKYGSVCSGIEAATVAWHPLGWEPAFFSEIEPFPCAVLQHHYPKVTNHGDMTRFREWGKDAIELLVGGTPCQSFSVAGLRKGLADPRGNLALVFLAIADRLRPRWVVWENVPGVLSSAEGRDFASFLGGLGQLGYGWAYRVLDAQYFGVPQRRRRVFVVGHLGDWRRAAAVLLERESLCGHPPPSRKEGQRTSHCLKGGSGSRGWENGAETADGLIETSPTLRGRPNSSHRADSQAYVPATPPLSHCLNGKGGSLRMDAESETLIPSGGGFEVAHALKAEGHDASEDGTGRGTPLVPIAFSGNDHGADAQYDVCPTIRVGGHGDSPGGAIPPAVAFQETESGTRESAEAGTLRSDGPGHDPVGTRVRQGMSVRRLTPRECERLQGFPDDYTLIPMSRATKKKVDDEMRAYYQRTGQEFTDEELRRLAADGPRYKALGNSMAVPVMRWIGKRIEEVDLS